MKKTKLVKHIINLEENKTILKIPEVLLPQNDLYRGERQNQIGI